VKTRKGTGVFKGAFAYTASNSNLHLKFKSKGLRADGRWQKREEGSKKSKDNKGEVKSEERK